MAEPTLYTLPEKYVRTRVPLSHSFLSSLPRSSAQIPLSVAFTHTWLGYERQPSAEARRRGSCGGRAPPVVCEHRGFSKWIKESSVI